MGREEGEGRRMIDREAEERVREALRASCEDAARVDGIPVRPHRAGEASFYEGFALRGIRVLAVRPGFLSCSFTVPPRLTDESGKMAAGAVVNLVDEVGSAAAIADGRHLKVSVDMSVSFVSPANLHDELEITSKVLGHKGGYSGTHVMIKKRANGEVVAEGRHSLFGKMKSNM